jgi:two-component system sensor histidine kinase HydH
LEEKVRRTEKLAAIGKLASGVAHEIRNPLSSIRGFAQFLRHALTDRPQEREYAEIMIKEMDRINRVVSDLLSFSRPDSADTAPTNVADLVEHVIRLVDADAKTKNVKIQSTVDPGTGKVSLDSYQITQALLNLLLNALKFSEDGFIHVNAEIDSNNSQLILQVEDAGPGIPPENMTNIFDPFFTTRAEGTGLGLAIVHKIVENHLGEIKVESPLPGTNGGTCFTITIPTS